MPGRLYAGTSGFAYSEWVPTFYPAGARSADLLRHYAGRLRAVELNNTFYRQPRPERVAAWLAAVPEEFRFVVKAQRGGSMRAFGSAAQHTIAWLTGPYRFFGQRLGAVLYRVPEGVRRDDSRLRALLTAWPADAPLALELQHESWHADEIFALLREHRAALCASDLDDADEPDLRLTGDFAYVRLRRTAYTDQQLGAWADRLAAFVADGVDCFAFFRHDAHGESALRAEALTTAVAARL